MNWEQFDSKVDIDGLNQEVNDLKKSDRKYEDLPYGKYQVTLDSLEMRATKAKSYPMMTMCFTVTHGDYTKRKEFVNQVLYNNDQNDKWRINDANQLLQGLDSGLDISFEKFSQYAKLIKDVAKRAIGEGYLLEIYEGKKVGSRYYRILEHFDDEL